MTRARTTALAASLGLATVCWFVSVSRMSGMDMGVETDLGSFPFFAALWVPMMAAMMLPSAAPAVTRQARAAGRAGAALLFAGSYLAVWAAVGLGVYALYRPHGTLAAGALTVAAGLYQLTPLERDCRRRCRENVRSGLRYGVLCVGSSIGLMVMLLALGAMSVGWMAIVAALVLSQKLVSPRASVDVPLALAIVALGVVVATEPSAIPGLTPAM
jgi:predicted metal-binding membrane protein